MVTQLQRDPAYLADPNLLTILRGAVAAVLSKTSDAELDEYRRRYGTTPSCEDVVPAEVHSVVLRNLGGLLTAYLTGLGVPEINVRLAPAPRRPGRPRDWGAESKRRDMVAEWKALLTQVEAEDHRGTLRRNGSTIGALLDRTAVLVQRLEPCTPEIARQIATAALSRKQTRVGVKALVRGIIAHRHGLTPESVRGKLYRWSF